LNDAEPPKEFVVFVGSENVVTDKLREIAIDKVVG
jgi:hypothetical protein